MTRNTSKRAMLMSLISMILCVSMLAGSTFAWFTDTATTGVNKITSGNLDIGLKYSTDYSQWTNAEGATDIFSANKWEPGYTEVVYFEVENKGSLAFQYKIGTNLTKSIKGVNVNGDEFDLTDYIKFGIVPVEAKFATREDALEEVEAPVDFTTLYNAEETLKSGEKAVFAMVVFMPETVGNVANHNGVNVPSIEFGVQVIGTQEMFEEDSYGPDYDEMAEWPVILTTTAEEFGDALTQKQEAKIILGSDLTLDGVTEIAGDKFIDLNGNELTVTEQKGITVPENSTLVVDNGTISYSSNDFAPIYVQSNSVVNIEDGVFFDITSEQVAGKWGMAAAIYLNQGSNSTVNINGGVINATGTYATGVYANYTGGGNFTVNFNGGVITVEGEGAIALDVVSKNTINLNGGVINVKGKNAYGFNVGQSQGQPTVVTGNGQTVINLYEGTKLSDDEDAAQFEGVAMTVNEAKVLTGTTEEVNDKLDEIVNNTEDSSLVELPKGEFTMPESTDKEITITGDKDAVVSVPSGVYATGSTITFKGITVEGSTAENSFYTTQLNGAKKVIYEDCTITGLISTYCDSEFINCVFENTFEDQYSVFCYSGNNSFTGCTFNSECSKAIKIYNEGKKEMTLDVTNCTFNTSTVDKAAIEIDSTYTVNYTVTITKCTITGAYQKLWNDKANNSTVIVDGVQVY